MRTCKKQPVACFGHLAAQVQGADLVRLDRHVARRGRLRLARRGAAADGARAAPSGAAPRAHSPRLERTSRLERLKPFGSRHPGPSEVRPERSELRPLPGKGIFSAIVT